VKILQIDLKRQVFFDDQNFDFLIKSIKPRDETYSASKITPPSFDFKLVTMSEDSDISIGFLGVGTVVIFGLA
jgi:hypothetical protein